MGKKRAIILGDESLEVKQKESAKKRKASKEIKKAPKEKTAVSEQPIDELATVRRERSRPFPTTKSVFKKHSQNYLKMAKMIDKKKLYSLTESVNLLKKISQTNFDSTVELHLNLISRDIKGTVEFPHGTGKQVRVVIFNNQVEEQIKNNQLNFDVLLATPADMKALIKYAKVLGPKGLMPSPKKGTLVDKPESAVKKFSSGATNLKVEPKFPLLHQIVGKISFSDKQLIENIKALIKVVQPKNITAGYLKSTMSPAIKLDIKTI